MVHICKIIISPGVFFSFPKFWFFRLLGRGKKAKNGPKWQKILSAMLHISGTIHHMIVIYGVVHMFKMIISPDFFFHFFKILIFWVVKRVKRQKTVQNDRKFCLSHFYTSYGCHLWYTCVIFFSSSKIWFFLLLGG